MKIRVLFSVFLLAAGSVFAAESVEPSAKHVDTPSEIARKLYDAMKKQDFVAVAALNYGIKQKQALQIIEVLKTLKQRAERGDKAAEAQLAAIEKSIRARGKEYEKFKFEIKSEVIEGDLAVVEFDVVRNDKLYLKRVGGEWKVILLDEYDAEKKKAAQK